MSVEPGCHIVHKCRELFLSDLGAEGACGYSFFVIVPVDILTGVLCCAVAAEAKPSEEESERSDYVVPKKVHFRFCQRTRTPYNNLSANLQCSAADRGTGSVRHSYTKRSPPRYFPPV